MTPCLSKRNDRDSRKNRLSVARIRAIGVAVAAILAALATVIAAFK